MIYSIIKFFIDIISKFVNNKLILEDIYIKLNAIERKHYLLKNDNIFKDSIEHFISKNVENVLKEQNIKLKNYYIHFYVMSDETKQTSCNGHILDLNDINDNKLIPIISILNIININSSPLIFTNYNLDDYKYKDYYTKNKILFLNSEYNQEIIFNSKYIFKNINLFSNNGNGNLVINIYDKKPKNIDYYFSTNEKKFIFNNQKKNINTVNIIDFFNTSNVKINGEKRTVKHVLMDIKIIDDIFWQKLFYEENNEIPKNILIELLNNIELYLNIKNENNILIYDKKNIFDNNKYCYNLFCIEYDKNIFFQKKKYEELKLMNLDNTEDVIKLIKKDKTSSKFDLIIFKNLFNDGYNIIFEIIKKDINGYIDNNIEKLIYFDIHCTKYCYFILKYGHLMSFYLELFQQIIKSFENNNNIKGLTYNILEIFCVVYSDNNINNNNISELLKENFKKEIINIKNNSHFIINIFLNDNNEYNGGNFIFSNEDRNNIISNKGDVIIYKSNINVTIDENISKGKKYVLQYFVEIIE